jgi:uncharacterized protein YegP (UPF0339 family)
MKAQIWDAAGGQYYVKVIASNGLTLAHSENYTSKQSATNCADLIAAGGTAEDKTV